MIRPDPKSDKYKEIEDVTEEAYTYIKDLEDYCNELEKELKIIYNLNLIKDPKWRR